MFVTEEMISQVTEETKAFYDTLDEIAGIDLPDERAIRKRLRNVSREELLTIVIGDTLAARKALDHFWSNRGL